MGPWSDGGERSWELYARLMQCHAVHTAASSTVATEHLACGTRRFKHQPVVVVVVEEEEEHGDNVNPALWPALIATSHPLGQNLGSAVSKELAPTVSLSRAVRNRWTSESSAELHARYGHSSRLMKPRVIPRYQASMQCK
jgi:hypothetical protein